MKFFIIFVFFAISLFGKADINSASLDELFGIKGFGCKTAARILEYRYQKGCFMSLDDLKKSKRYRRKNSKKA